MFDSIGWGEILVIALAALFIFGPDRLPSLARDAAGAFARIRGAIAGLRGAVDDAFGDELAALRELDPRHYNPHRMLREGFLSDGDG